MSKTVYCRDMEVTNNKERLRLEKLENGKMKIGSNTNREVKQDEIMARHSLLPENLNPEKRWFKWVSVGNMEQFTKRQEIRKEVLDGQGLHFAPTHKFTKDVDELIGGTLENSYSSLSPSKQ